MITDDTNDFLLQIQPCELATFYIVSPQIPSLYFHRKIFLTPSKKAYNMHTKTKGKF